MKRIKSDYVYIQKNFFTEEDRICIKLFIMHLSGLRDSEKMPTIMALYEFIDSIWDTIIRYPTFTDKLKKHLYYYEYPLEYRHRIAYFREKWYGIP